MSCAELRPELVNAVGEVCKALKSLFLGQVDVVRCSLDLEFFSREAAVEFDELVGGAEDAGPVLHLDELNLTVVVPDHPAVFVGKRSFFRRVQRIAQSLDALDNRGAQKIGHPLRLGPQVLAEASHEGMRLIGDDPLNRLDGEVVFDCRALGPDVVLLDGVNLSGFIGVEDSAAGGGIREIHQSPIRRGLRRLRRRAVCFANRLRLVGEVSWINFSATSGLMSEA